MSIDAARPAVARADAQRTQHPARVFGYAGRAACIWSEVLPSRPEVLSGRWASVPTSSRSVRMTQDAAG